MKTIVIGIGNPILGDDGVGIHVAREFKKLVDDPSIFIEEAFTGGMNLLDMIVGFDRAILVDAISVDNMDIGGVVVVDATKMESAHSANPHDVSFPEALELARKMGEKKIPSEITLVGINIEGEYEFKEELSQMVKLAIPEALDEVNRLI